ncbi:hypothetical protein C8R42DRAFT_729202 [Lentinula raphanica]|nr:hypothetical protein C8R42DRAFT_729202 [Lentinula raphanica]
MPAPVKINLDTRKYRPSNKSATRIRDKGTSLTLYFEEGKKTSIELHDVVCIKNRLSNFKRERELLSYGTIRGILEINKEIKVLVTWFLRKTEIEKYLRKIGYPPELIAGLAENEFVDTDIEGIIDERDVLDLAGLHLLTDDIEDVDFHLLTAKAYFYRFFLSTKTGRLDVLGNGRWFDNICNVCKHIYDPDTCYQVYCQGCRHWFCILHVDPLPDPEEAKGGKPVTKLSADKSSLEAPAQTGHQLSSAPPPVPSSTPPPVPSSTPPPVPSPAPPSSRPAHVVPSSTRQRTSSAIAGTPPSPATSDVAKAGKDKDNNMTNLGQKGQEEKMDVDEEGPKQDEDMDMDHHKNDDDDDGESEIEDQNDDGDNGDGETDADAESEETKDLGRITVTYLPPIRVASHATNHSNTNLNAKDSPPKILKALRQAPILRGLGWEQELYPHGHAAGVHGWLVTGNHFLHSTKWKPKQGFPGGDWANTWALSYEQGSRATPQAVAESMMAVLPAIEQDWKCPLCHI